MKCCVTTKLRTFVACTVVLFISFLGFANDQILLTRGQGALDGSETVDATPQSNNWQQTTTRLHEKDHDPNAIHVEKSEISSSYKSDNTSSLKQIVMSGNWTFDWLDQGTNQEPARIWFVHVGKTGGVSLKEGLLMDLRRKRNALPCMINSAFQERATDNYNHNNNNDDNDNTIHHPTSTEGITKLAAANATAQKTLTFEDAWSKCYRPSQAAPALGRHVLSQKHTYLALLNPSEFDWVVNHVNTFLVTLRNPVARVVSAFYYHRHGFETSPNLASKKDSTARVFFSECFASAIQLADALAADVKPTEPTSGTPSQGLATSSTKDCTELARKVLQGKGPEGDNLQHFHYNYQFYEAQSIRRRPTVPVVVVRTERMWEDAKQLDLALGGDGIFAHDGHHHTHGSEKFSPSKNERGSSSRLVRGTSREDRKRRQAICCAIYLDIASMQRFVLRALNLNHTEKVKTMQQTFDECGVTTKNDPVLLPFDWDDWHNESCASTTQS
ncbi:hypothetical protein ACA910_002674 [Epithemia clementina (nom. ined.)]